MGFLLSADSSAGEITVSPNPRLVRIVGSSWRWGSPCLRHPYPITTFWRAQGWVVFSSSWSLLVSPFSLHFLDTTSLPLETSDVPSLPLFGVVFYPSKERNLIPLQAPGMRIRMNASSLGGNDIRSWEMLPLQNEKPNRWGPQGEFSLREYLLSAVTKAVLSNSSPENYSHVTRNWSWARWGRRKT